ncbi:MAG: metallophosphoesterase [bacterium]
MMSARWTVLGLIITGFVCLLLTEIPARTEPAGSGAAAASARGRVGMLPEIPAGYSQREVQSLVLMGHPTITVENESVAVIRFQTAMPTPAARIYYGTFLPDQILLEPRYRRTEKENLDTLSTAHEIRFELAPLMAASIDVNRMAENGGGVVAYRLEIYDPQEARGHFYDSRFEFKGRERIPTIIEGPFVDQVTPTGAVISWESDLPAKGTVWVGTKAYPAGENLAMRHEIKLTDLQPGMRQTYRIELTGGRVSSTGREFYFHTPAPGLTRFRFATLGDSREGVGGGEMAYGGANLKVLERLTADAFNREAEFIIHTGDMINGYTTSPLDFDMQLKAFKHAMEPVGRYIPIYEIMGNHESLVDRYEDSRGRAFSVDKTGNGSAEELFGRAFVNPENGPEPETAGAPSYKENVYTFDYGPCRFVVMNNNYWWCSTAERVGANLEGYVLDKQWAWLQQVFRQATENPAVQHLFLLAQEPMFPNDGHVGDAMWYHGGDPEKNGGIDRKYVVERRDEIWEAFVATGKARVGIFGDEHNYSRTLVDARVNPRYARPAWQVISGGAGAPYHARNPEVPWAEQVRASSVQIHYVLFEVDGPAVHMEAISDTGEIIDRADLAP